jgi:Bifunctional DNA primase/polymerase, N-terminal
VQALASGAHLDIMTTEEDGFRRDEAADTMAAMNEAIHDYVERGWSVIPIRPGDKRPLVRWEEFQHRRADKTVALGWFRTWPDAGIGVVTGAISGIVVIDVDVRHGVI